MPPLTGTDPLTSLGPQWEWNHNPDTTKFSTGPGGLTLNTATITFDLYSARNTLSHRIHYHPHHHHSGCEQGRSRS